MKPLHHHVQRLATRMLQAETASTHEEASKILEKAEKHRKKISLLARLTAPLENLFRLN